MNRLISLIMGLMFLMFGGSLSHTKHKDDSPRYVVTAMKNEHIKLDSMNVNADSTAYAIGEMLKVKSATFATIKELK